MERDHLEDGESEQAKHQIPAYLFFDCKVRVPYLFHSVAPISQSMTIFSAIPLIPGLNKVLRAVLLFIGRK